MEIYREVESVTNKQPLDEKIDRNKRGKGEGRRLVVSSQPRIGAVVKKTATLAQLEIKARKARDLKPGEEEEAACGDGGGRKRKRRGKEKWEEEV